MPECSPWDVRSKSVRLAMPKATVYRFLQTMKTLGYVNQEGESDKYTLSLKLFELGGKAPVIIFDDADIDKGLVGLGDRQGIDRQVSRNLPDRRQGVSLGGGALQNHLDDPLPDLKKDRLLIVELAHVSALLVY